MNCEGAKGAKSERIGGPGAPGKGVVGRSFSRSAMPSEDSAADGQRMSWAGGAIAAAVDDHVDRAAGDRQEPAVEVTQQQPGGVDVGGERSRRDAAAAGDAGAPPPPALVVPAAAKDQVLDQRIQPWTGVDLEQIVN